MLRASQTHSVLKIIQAVRGSGRRTLSLDILHGRADSSAAPLANYFNSNYFWQSSVAVVGAPKKMPIVEDADFDANLFGFG